MTEVHYVFGYASLVGMGEAYSHEVEDAPQPGRLRGFRRRWGVAMDNWRGGDGAKHWLHGETGERPRIRVAYLDLYEQAGTAVNGLALPVDRARLEALDAREGNYRRLEVTAAFSPDGGQAEAGRALDGARVYAYIGLEEARERCRRGVAEGDAFVARAYVAEVRRAFEALSPGALAEFDRTTDPLPFPERDLSVVFPGEP